MSHVHPPSFSALFRAAEAFKPDCLPVYPIYREYSSVFSQNIIETTTRWFSYDLLRPLVGNDAAKRRQHLCHYHFSKGTLDSLKHNRNISTATLNDICRILSCRVEDVLRYIPEE